MEQTTKVCKCCFLFLFVCLFCFVLFRSFAAINDSENDCWQCVCCVVLCCVFLPFSLSLLLCGVWRACCRGRRGRRGRKVEFLTARVFFLFFFLWSS